MKRFLAIAAFAAALVASVSCNKEMNVVPTTTKTLSVGFESRTPDSKTYVRDVNAGTIWWANTNTDKILYVFDAAGTKYNFVSTSTTSEATREFTCDTWPVDAEVKFALWSGKVATGSDPDASTVSGNIISGLRLPSAQSINNAHSFANNANIAVMKEGDTSLRNVFGYIRYTIPAVNDLASIKNVSITADEDLAGNVQVDYSGDAPVATVVSGGAKTVSANTRYKDKYEAGTYYLIVPAGTYHNVKITITPFAQGADPTDQNAATAAPFTLTAKNAVVVERSKYTDAGTLPYVNPNGGEEEEEDDDIEWPEDEDAFDYGLNKGVQKTAEYPESERTTLGIASNYVLADATSVTLGKVTYYGKCTFYGNRWTTDSKPGPSVWMDGYTNVIPQNLCFSWKINRPGKFLYFPCVGNQTTIDRGVVYKIAILKTVGGDTTAEIVTTYTPTAEEFDITRQPWNHEDMYLEFEITKDQILGIDEAATVYLWAAHPAGKLNVQIHHFPIKWTPTAKQESEKNN